MARCDPHRSQYSYQISSPLIDQIRNQPGTSSVSCVVLLLQQEFAHRLAMHGGPDSVGPLGSEHGS